MPRKRKISAAEVGAPENNSSDSESEQDPTNGSNAVIPVIEIEIPAANSGSSSSSTPATLKKVGSIVGRLRDRSSIKRVITNISFSKRPSSLKSKGKKNKSASVISVEEFEFSDDDIIEIDDSNDEDYFDPSDPSSKTSSRKSKKGAKYDSDDEEDDENMDEEGDDENEDEEDGGKKSKSKGKGKQPAKKRAKKSSGPSIGKSKKQIVELEAKIKENIAEREGKLLPKNPSTKSHTPDTSCCRQCSAREFIRAASTGDVQLLDKALAEKIAHYNHGTPADDPAGNALAAAIQGGNQEIIRKLLKSTFGVDPPYRYLNSGSSTGYVHRNTYGHDLRAVNESRGNREGNNAFYSKEYVSPFDIGGRGRPVTNTDAESYALRVSCRNHDLNLEILDQLYLDGGSTYQHMTNWMFQEAVAAGNRKVALKILEKISESGFNDLHREALSTEEGQELSAFRSVSVIKKATGNFSIAPLHCAAINPNTEVIEKLVSTISPSDVLHTDEIGRTALHYAAACEGPGPLQFLLQTMPYQSTDSSKLTPLLLAAKYGRAENVRILIEAGGGTAEAANSTFLSSNCTALHLAAHYGHLDVVNVLITHGANVNAIMKKTKMTPLIEASRMGHVEVVARLIEAGAYIFLGDNMGKTPLHYATKNGRFDVVVKLLSLGADAGYTDSSLNTPLHYACGYGWKDIAKVLIEYGKADINAFNCWKYTPLGIADLKGHRGIMKYLLKIPEINVNFLDKDGFSLIHKCVQTEVTTAEEAESVYQTLKLMLTHGGNANALSVNSDTALHLLAGNTQVIRNVFKSPFAEFPKTSNSEDDDSDKDEDDDDDDADDDGSDDDGTDEDSEEEEEVPAEEEKKSDEENKFDDEALSDYHLRCAELLLKHNCEVDVANKDEKTALGISMSCRKIKLATFLLKHGSSILKVKMENGRNFMHCFTKLLGEVEIGALAVPEKLDYDGFEQVKNRARLIEDRMLDLIEVLKEDKYQNDLKEIINQPDIKGFTPALYGLESTITVYASAKTTLKNAVKPINSFYNRYNLAVANEATIEIPLSISWKFWVDTVKLLFNLCGGNVNAGVDLPKDFNVEKDKAPDFSGFTLLHYAAQNLLGDLVSQLLQFPNIKVNSVSKNGKTALHLLLSKSAIVEKEEDFSGVQTLPSTVVENQKFKFVNYKLELAQQLNAIQSLLNAGADPIVQDVTGRTPLFCFVDSLAKDTRKPVSKSAEKSGKSVKKIGFTTLSEDRSASTPASISTPSFGTTPTFGSVPKQFGSTQLFGSTFSPPAPSPGFFASIAPNNGSKKSTKNVEQELTLLRKMITATKKTPKGFDLHPKDDLRTILTILIQKGYDDFAELVVEAGANINFVGQNSNSVAMIAVQTRRISAMKAILSADMSIANDELKTPLIAACADSPKIADLLLESSESIVVNHVDKLGQSALIVACESSLPSSTIRKLVDVGADIHYKTPEGKTALIAAINLNNLVYVQTLISAAADKSRLVNVCDSDGVWALHHAVLKNNYKIVGALLNAGADTNVERAKDKASALHLAIQLTKSAVNKSMKIERDLIAHGANLNAVDFQGRTPMHIAFIELGRVPQMEVTTKEKSEIDKYNAAKEKQESRIKLLIDGVDAFLSEKCPTAIRDFIVNWRLQLDAENSKMVDESVKFEYAEGEWKDFVLKLGKTDPVEIVDFLLQHADVDCLKIDSFGRTPLHYAAIVGASSSTNGLLSKNVKIDCKDLDGNTPIQLALHNDNVDYFLNMALRGAQADGELILPSGTKETSFKFALSRDFMSIAYLIKQQGPNILKAIDDSLRTGKYSMAIALSMSANKEDLLQTDSNGRTLCHIIGDFSPSHAESWAEDYLPDLFNLVTETGINCVALDNNLRTPLMCAAKHGQAELMTLLLPISKDVLNNTDDGQLSALSHCLQSYRSLALVEILLSNGAKPDCGDYSKRLSDMRLAVDSGNKDIVKSLIRSKANLDADGVDTNGKCTALMTAIRREQREMTKSLLFAGANPDRIAPLKVANKMINLAPILGCKSLETLKILLENKASPNVFHPEDQRTLLMMTLDENNFEKIRILLKYNADLNVIDPKHDRSPFQRMFYEKGYENGLKEAMKYQPNLSMADNITGKVPLDHAIRNRDVLLVKELINKGVDQCVCSLPKINPHAMTPLMNAVQLNEIPLINELLVDGKFDVDVTDNRGRTALHYAVQTHESASVMNTDIAKILVDKGFKFDAKDNEGKTPADLANLQKSDKMLKFLAELGSTPSIARLNEKDEMEIDYPDAPDFKQAAEKEKTVILERMRLKNKQKMQKEAEKRGVTFEKLEKEEKEKAWIKPCHLANVDTQQVRVLYEGDGYEKYVPYDVMLHKCDVSKGVYGENKFYQMQILYNHLQDIHFLFNRWGGLGSYSDGMYQKTPFKSKAECVAEFEKIFKSKSGNVWDPDGEFVPKPGKYRLMKTSKRENITVEKVKQKGCPPSSIDEHVKDVLRMFTNSSKIYKSIDSFYSDDHLDEESIEKALDLLTKVQKLVKKMEELQKETVPHVKEQLNIRQELVILSSEYFRLVPAKEFGDNGIQPIMNSEALNQQLVKVANLKYVDLVSTIFLAALHNRATINPFDYIYSTLQSRITPLDIESSENQLITQAIKTTNLDGVGDNVDVISILSIDRKGESEAFAAHSGLGNHRLLWHGSGISNFFGILSSGLRVAPINSACTGYMFGKGIYFSDMFSKAYGYTGGNEYSCLMLCEVALGNMWESTEAEYMEAPKPDCHSTKGLGQQEPANTIIFNDSGSSLSVGPVKTNVAKDKNKPLWLRMNEYIVYDPTQVKMRYIVIVRNRDSCCLCGSGSAKSCLSYLKDSNKKVLEKVPELGDFEIEIANFLIKQLNTSPSEIYQNNFVEKMVKQKIYERRWSPTLGLKDTSKICKGCAELCLVDLIECFVTENKNLLPDEISQRPDCWYGRKCRSRESKYHCWQYNHYCDNTKNENEKS